MEFKKTPVILVATHGSFCEGIIETARMIFGEIEGLEALPLREGMDVNVYYQEMDSLIEKYDGDVILCLDIVGGTPYNTAMRIACKRELCAVAGVNLPMLFSAIEVRETQLNADMLAAQVAEEAAGGILDITKDLRAMYEQMSGRNPL